MRRVLSTYLHTHVKKKCQKTKQLFTEENHLMNAFHQNICFNFSHSPQRSHDQGPYIFLMLMAKLLRAEAMGNVN